MENEIISVLKPSLILGQIDEENLLDKINEYGEDVLINAIIALIEHPGVTMTANEVRVSLLIINNYILIYSATPEPKRIAEYNEALFSWQGIKEILLRES